MLNLASKKDYNILMHRNNLLLSNKDAALQIYDQFKDIKTEEEQIKQLIKFAKKS